MWPQPGLLVAPGDNITLWCSRPKLSSHEEVTFTLSKAGTRKPLLQQISAHLWTSFSFPSVKPEDHGSYSCTYRKQKEPAKQSEPSEALQLVVPGEEGCGCGPQMNSDDPSAFYPDRGLTETRPGAYTANSALGPDRFQSPGKT